MFLEFEHYLVTGVSVEFWPEVLLMHQKCIKAYKVGLKNGISSG